MKLRFVPGRAIIGTARAMKRGIVAKQYKQREVYYHEGFLAWLVRAIDEKLGDPVPEGLAETREAFYKEHGYYPPYDPRD